MSTTLTRLLFATVTACLLFTVCSCDMVNETPGTSGIIPSASPSVSPSILPGNSEAMDGSATALPIESALSEAGDTIRDFVEGTIVDIESVPHIVKAVTDKYEKSKVTGITHATHLDKQVYEVTYTDEQGTTHTVYVSPDGKTVTEAVEPSASTQPSPSESAPEAG
ncbi:MAG: hypothetical protein IJO93_04630 [Clostridia bacterium]|nr:hypothetical protein [Clostridia bacterium]